MNYSKGTVIKSARGSYRAYVISCDGFDAKVRSYGLIGLTDGRILEIAGGYSGGKVRAFFWRRWIDLRYYWREFLVWLRWQQMKWSRR